MAPTDARFARLTTDPRFRRPKQKTVKAEIDERFKDVLSEDFGKDKGKARVDKRGRVVSSTHGADEMKRFYRMRSPEAEDGPRIDYARGEGLLESSGDEDESSDEDSDVDEDELELGGKRKSIHAFVPSDSEFDSDSDNEHIKVNLSDSEDDEEGESAFPADMKDDDDEEEEEEEGVDPTTRLAAVNLDWDNMRAHDLFNIFNSFLRPMQRKSDKSAPPPPGKLLSVCIYPSEFGKERMILEDAAGPGGGIFKSKPGDKRKKDKGGKRTQRLTIAKSDTEEEDDEEEYSDDEEEDEMGEGDEDDAGEPSELEDDGLDPIEDNLEILDDVSEAGSDDVDMEKLRQYQLERLRYYYAIAKFSTVEAAELVHNELNGTEFERTANILDLSYVPEDMEFADDEVHDECTKEPKGYKGNDYVTDALRHSKVKLTWDQDDPNRAKMTRRALTREEIDEEDFRNLVAASSDEESDDEVEEEIDGDASAAEVAAKEKKKSKKEKMKERKDKLRALLLADDNETGDIWGKAGTAWQDELADIKGQGKKDKEAVEITFRPGLSAATEDDNLTSLQRYQLRMKEKKSKKKEKFELRREDREGREGDDEPKDKKDKPKKKAVGDDDFFGGSDDDDDTPAATKRARSPSPEADELGLVEDSSHHFSLKDHISAEKADAAGKKRKRNRKSKKAEERDRVAELGPEGFKVDVADPRFAAMYDEPSFAVDPTHPKFTNIEANREILKRTREKHASKREGEAPAAAAGERDLSALVQSVKAKMDGPKRKRTRKH